MSSVNRYRSGPQRVVTGLIFAGDFAEIGDLVALDGGYVKPAALYTDSQTAAFHDLFLGVLIEGGTTGDETVNSPCVVGVTGDYEFDCASVGVLAPGTPFGPADGGSTLASQTVAQTVASTEAVGKLSRQTQSGDTSVTISIRSRIMDQPYA